MATSRIFYVNNFFFRGAGVRPPPVGQGLLIVMIHDHTQTHPHSLGLLWMSDQLIAETSA